MLNWLERKLFVTRYESGGGGGGSTSTTNTQVNYSPEEQADRQKIRTEAERLFNATPADAPYPGAGIAPLTPDTNAAQDYIRSAVAGPLATSVSDINNATQFGLSDILYGKDPTLDAAISASVRPIYQSYTDPGGFFSQLRTEMGNNNTVGGSRDAIGRSVLAGRYAQAAGDTAAKLAAQSRQDTLGTFTKTLALAPQSMQATLQPAVALSAVGEQNQAQQQAGLDYQTQQNLWDLNYPWQRLNNFASLVYGGQSPGTTTTANTPTARANPVTGALGGAMAGASLGSVVPGIGTAAGAIVGGIMGLLGS